MLPFSFRSILSASSLEFGLLIKLSLSDITLSAPKTSVSGKLLLTFTAFNSAKFFDIIKGSAPSLKKILLPYLHQHLNAQHQN